MNKLTGLNSVATAGVQVCDLGFTFCKPTTKLYVLLAIRKPNTEETALMGVLFGPSITSSKFKQIVYNTILTRSTTAVDPQHLKFKE